MVEVRPVWAQGQLEVVLCEGEEGALGRCLFAELELFQDELQLIPGAEWGMGIVINVGVGRKCSHGWRHGVRRLAGYAAMGGLHKGDG